MTTKAIMRGYANYGAPRAMGDGTEGDVKINRMGELCVMDFYTQAVLEGRVYQVKAGTITAPLVGDGDITDTKCEMYAQANSGMTLLPVYVNIATRLAAATLFEYAVKSVGAAAVTAANFIPLPLYMGGPASRCVAAVGQTGAIEVAAEANTTTRTHYHYANPLDDGDGHGLDYAIIWQPQCPPPLAGVACVYVQVAGDTTGPEHFTSLDYIEMETVNVS